MTDEQINIAIAESLGWTNCRLVIKGAGGGTRYPTAHGMPPNRKYESSCPNYTADLNACREFEKTLTCEQQVDYARRVGKMATACLPSSRAAWMDFELINARPYIKCRAYLETLGKWIE